MPPSSPSQATREAASVENESHSSSQCAPASEEYQTVHELPVSSKQSTMTDISVTGRILEGISAFAFILYCLCNQMTADE